MIDVLFTHPSPFTIKTLFNLDRLDHPQTYGYAFAPYQDRWLFPWLENNDLSINTVNEPIFKGIFNIDQDHQRILYFPGKIASKRDSYRSSFAPMSSNFDYMGSLHNLLQVVEGNDIPFYQATQIRDITNQKLGRTMGDYMQWEQTRRKVEKAFTESTRYEGSEAYQIEGHIQLEQILKGTLLPIKEPLLTEAWISELQTFW